MTDDRSYIEDNARELEHMRRLIEGLDDEALGSRVNESWTVAGVLAHIAFWDARVLSLAGKVDRGEPFDVSDEEPEEVDWINDASRPFILALRPRDAAALALAIAEETDARVVALPLDRMYPHDPGSPLNAVRYDHRAEHLDDIEAALRARG